MIAASELLQNVYKSSLVICRFIYIYAKIYAHYSYIIYDIFLSVYFKNYLWFILAVLDLCCWAWASDYSDFSGCRAQALGQASAVAAPELQSTNSIVGAHGLSCSTACGIFLDQASNWCLPHWQTDSLPLSHQGSPCILFFDVIVFNMLNYICVYVCVCIKSTGL